MSMHFPQGHPQRSQAAVHVPSWLFFFFSLSWLLSQTEEWNVWSEPVPLFTPVLWRHLVIITGAIRRLIVSSPSIISWEFVVRGDAVDLTTPADVHQGSYHPITFNTSYKNWKGNIEYTDWNTIFHQSKGRLDDLSRAVMNLVYWQRTEVLWRTS